MFHNRFLTLALSLLIFTPNFALAEPAVQDLKIGWIGPLTGDAAFLGVDSVDVAKREFTKAASDTALKIKPKLFIEDDQYEATKTLKAYHKLVHLDGVKVIFVLSYGGTIALAPLAQKDNVLLLNPLDCDDELASLPANTFCVAKKTEDLGLMNALQAVKNKDLPAAIIYTNADPFGPKVARATKEGVENGGGIVTFFEGVSPRMSDFRTLLARINASGAKSIFFYGYDGFGSAMKQGREIGLKQQYYALASINSPGFLELSRDTVNNTIAAGWFAPRTEKYAAFLSEHKGALGREPLLEVATVPTFDIAHLIIDGMKAQQGASKASFNIDTLREYLYKVKGYEGLSGTISVDPDGAVRSLKVGVYKFINKKFEPLL